MATSCGVAIFLFGAAGEKMSTGPTTKNDIKGVWITRSDGSLQCDPKEEGTKNDPLKKAQAQLEKSGVKVFEAKKRNDGAMHAAACGITTGNQTAFLIEKADLAKAKALGFEALKE